MTTKIKTPKKEKDPKVESLKLIDNQEKAAMHLETAAKHLHDAAKFQKEGNNTMACGCNSKAKDQSNLAKKIQKKNQKKQLQIT